MKKITRSSALLLTLLGACGGERSAEPEVPHAGDTAAAAPAQPADTTQAAADTGFLDPNTVTREQLLTVPGMNPAAADALIGGRPYADMRGVDAALAAHVDSTAREAVYGRVWKKIDLNRATAEEIELIPGVGPRIRHEFEEYRPYRDLARFRREMGKYVDEAEVARLERYVTINP